MSRSASEAVWSYRPAGDAGVVEFGAWRGRGAPGLHPHFHDEDQVVIVLAGCRAFLIDGEVMTVAAGRTARIPAGVLHVPLVTTDDETVCLNAYVPAGPVAGHDQGDLRAILAESLGRVGDIAAGRGQSREGFSRGVTRQLGVGPHAFRVLARLNRARELLRQGQSIAHVAVDTGFSDQSHMTRLFHRTFGTTPGLYRRG